MSSINIIDTTLRDGLQNPEMPEHGKYTLSIEERQEIFTSLVKFGIKYVELFSPLVNQQESNSLQSIIRTRNELISEYGKTNILAHIRANPQDVQSAIQAGVDGLNLYIGTSQESRQYNHGKNLEEIINLVKPLIAQTRQDHPHLLLRFSGEDAFRTPLPDLFAVYDQIADYVDRFGMPDTVGVATPELVASRVQALKERYPTVNLEGHFHNDRGLSLINSITATNTGMTYMNTSVLGLAERSGITSLTGYLFNLFLQNPDQVTQFNLDESYALNVLVASIMNMQVPFTEPISLTNNTHSAGVHTSAMLNNSHTYQAHPLANFGVSQAKLLLGPLSGWHVVNYYLIHILNYEPVNENLVKQLTQDFKNSFQQNQNIKPTDLLKQIATQYNLTKKSKPITHFENI